MNSSNSAEQRKTYNKYSRDMRLRLIKLVEEQKISTAQAGRIIGIKQTSACRIINSYRKHNRIFERKADKIRRQTQQDSQRSAPTDKTSKRPQEHPNAPLNDPVVPNSRKEPILGLQNKVQIPFSSICSAYQFNNNYHLPMPLGINYQNQPINRNFHPWMWPYFFPS